MAGTQAIQPLIPQMPHTLAQIIRSRRRTVSLEITPEARLIVRAPYGVSEGHVREVVASRRAWIDRKLAVMRERKPARAARTFSDGDMFLYLGNEYPLRVIDDAGAALSFDNGFFLHRRYACIARRVFIAWYRAQAQCIFEERVRIFSTASGLECGGIVLSDARSRWGCCTPSNTITLSWRLGMAPLAVIDYVVAHELAHVAHRNHSGRFWNKVARLYPGFQEHRRWLRENGYRLIL